MTVSAQTPINRSTGNGVTAVFPYTFKIISDGDIEVSVDDVVKTLNVDYTVSGAGLDAGGDVTMTTAPAVGTAVVRRRDMAIVRSTDYQDQGTLPAATLDLDIDSTVLMMQQLDERMGRTFSLPASSAADGTMPAPVGGYVLGWDALGKNLTNLPASAGTSLIDLAASSGSSLAGFIQSGTGAVATTVQTKLRESVSVKDFGALGDGITDDTVAVQLALNYAETGGKLLRFPSGVYVISSGLTVTNDSDGGITLEGESSSDYLFSGGSVLKYTGGAGTFLTFDGSASPIFCKIKNITFLGNSGADVGVKLNRGWFFNAEGCIFYNWSKAGASALALTYSTGGFVGVTTIRDCGFYNNTVSIFWEKSDVNVIRVEDCRFNAGTCGILQGVSGVACSSRNVNIIGCMFDTVDAYAIYSWGGAQNWNIIGNYFEQNNAAVNTPRICISTQPQSPQNCAITISGNTFSKQLASASTNLVYLASVNGAVVENNWSAVGDQVDRYSVEMINCTNKRVMQFSVPSGSAPYPIKDDTALYTTGSVEKMAGGLTIQSAVNFPPIQSASTDPNALDDYREGTWTPSNGYVTFASATGTYVKVGQNILATFSITFPVNAQSNQAEIIGLPHSSSAGSINISFSDYGSGFYIRNSFINGGAFFSLAGVALTNANFSGKTVEGSFTYRANQ